MCALTIRPILFILALAPIGKYGTQIGEDTLRSMEWVRGIHAKDGLLPTDPKKLGEEVIIGKGKVDFPTVLKQLKQVNYRGSRNIERQIGGDQQRKDILDSKIFLQNLIAKTYSQGLLFF
jgi:L-ribulose-5-phosphate 3-epimerase UlaE